MAFMASLRVAVVGLSTLLLASVVLDSCPIQGQAPDVQEQIQDALDAMRQGMAVRRQPPTHAEIAEPDNKLEEAIRRISKILDAQCVECKRFHDDLPLAVFLASLEKQFAKGKPGLALRLDAQAFGDKQKDVAATPISLKALRADSISLRRAVEAAIKKVKVTADYRIGPVGVTITTPERALYTSTYDIRDIVARPMGPPLYEIAGKELAGEPAQIQRAATLVQTLISPVADYRSNPAIAGREAIQVLNGNRLLIHTTGSVHAQVSELLDALRHLGDMAVFVNAQLYEVDDALYRKIKNAKRPSPKELDELENEAGNQEKEKAGKEEGPQKRGPLLKKENLVLAGDEVRIDNGQESSFLSRHQATDLLPSPEQIGDARRQVVLEGVSFLAEVVVSADRRFIRLKLTEKASTIQQIAGGKFPRLKKVIGTETAFMSETKQSQVLEIPDGGSILVAVGFRTRSVQAKNRRWVLHIQPRIHIPAEEQLTRASTLEELLPSVVADILKNPGLKSTRDFYGTAGDMRLALVNSTTFQWPSDFKLDPPGYQLSQAHRKGKRLLGIRVDKYQRSSKENDKHLITLTLLNVGGIDNGAVPGGGTIHYTARSVGQGWAIELSDVFEGHGHPQD